MIVITAHISTPPQTSILLVVWTFTQQTTIQRRQYNAPIAVNIILATLGQVAQLGLMGSHVIVYLKIAFQT